MRTILILICLIPTVGLSQFGFMEREDIAKLENDTLVVVLRSDETFNENFKFAVQNNWTLSPYKFVKEADLRNHYRTGEEIFMLGHFNGMFYLNPNGMDNVEFIGIINRARLKASVPSENREDIQAHLFYNPVNTGKGYLSAYVRVLDSYLRKIKSKIVNSQMGYIKHVGSMEKEAEGKDILIDFENDFHMKQDEISGKNKDLVKASSKDEIDHAIIQREKSVFFLPFSGGGRYFLYMVSCDDGDIHYYTHVRDWGKLPGVAEKKMLKALE